MAAVRVSPTANLLRKSRLFALPQALQPPQDPPSSKTVFESATATLPHPIRASIVTPPKSLARGDWGLKRSLPAKSTSEKSSRPVVRVQALDTYEHVTDFESAADHTMTLEKFQELHMPMSLPTKMNYASSIVPRHQSPFDAHVDNTETSQTLSEPGAKQYRHSGPWLSGLSQVEFDAYLKTVRRDKPELLKKLRERFEAKRFAEARKLAQDKGEDLENLKQTKVTDAEFQTYIKSLRADPFSMGPVIFELLDLPSSPAVPSERIGTQYFQSPGTKMSTTEYAVTGPPKTHPSAGLAYSRSHALTYNHPKYGPQIYQRPVQARILRPKGRFKGRVSKAIAGVGGVAIEDLNAMSFSDQGAPPGLSYFDATIEGGGKYWVNPIRAAVDSEGRIRMSTFRASASSKAPYGIEDYRKPGTTSITDAARRDAIAVPRLDRDLKAARFKAGRQGRQKQPSQSTDEVARNLVESLGN
ncbi:hypothetical protein N7456_011030 [Penicillium angulare]|uniref:Mitochondrial ribosomal protein MRP51 n=1 Tax=Penicillium angulare TaxID=116970 RepID=A0A9W9ET64_9EURO|nr:hypothetical protein N7456_011030 [Penicillium angulare]